MGRRSNDQPLHLTRVRVIPCKDVSAIYNTVLKRVLNARAALPVPAAQPNSDDADAVGGDACPCPPQKPGPDA